MKKDMGIRLRDKLLSIYNDKDFAMGAMVSAGEKQWSTLLDMIETEEGLTSDRISLIAIALGEHSDKVRGSSGRGLIIDDRTDSFVPNYADKTRSISEQYDEYCRNNPLPHEMSN